MASNEDPSMKVKKREASCTFRFYFSIYDISWLGSSLQCQGLGCDMT